MFNRIVLFAVLVFVGILAFGVRARTAAAYPGADGLSASMQCSPDGSLTVFLNWTAYDAGTQYLDWSQTGSTFAPGTYRSAGPLAINVTSVSWAGFAPVSTYYIRVNTLIGAVWYPSQVLTVSTLSCPVVKIAPVAVPVPVPFPYPQPYPMPPVPQPLPVPPGTMPPPIPATLPAY